MALWPRFEPTPRSNGARINACQTLKRLALSRHGESRRERSEDETGAVRGARAPSRVRPSPSLRRTTARLRLRRVASRSATPGCSLFPPAVAGRDTLRR